MSHILYSFRRCPYAMRARMALWYAEIPIELREVVLKNKPAEMIALSPKATVPVLYTGDEQVIDESVDIMRWALEKNDPDAWLQISPAGEALIIENDGDFKQWLDRYKYSDRHPETEEYYREKGVSFIQKLEQALQDSPYLQGQNVTLVDMAIFPFIRQFAHVDKDWFFQADFPKVQAWLNGFLEGDLFKSIMKKYKPWESGSLGISAP
ncbi:MAG: glutathione S-transferase [Cellvibrionaceae bacterium]